MENKNTLLIKLQAVKSELGKVSKDSTNPFFKSKYFDVNQLLEHCEPLLQKNNLVLLQPIELGNVVTRIYCIESGEFVESTLALPNLPDPQKLGSAITYFRRYTLQSLLGLQAEDDDGNKASKPSKAVLTTVGFDFLINEGTEEQIKTALKTRVMTKQQKTELTNKNN